MSIVCVCVCVCVLCVCVLCVCVCVCVFVCPDSNCITMKAFIVEINFDIVVSYKLKY